MVVAQAIGEYGGVAGAISGSLNRAWIGVQSFLYDMEPTTWAIVAGFVLVVWYFRAR
jgi:hypothetical protein